jgi:hypothetical protein
MPSPFCFMPMYVLVQYKYGMADGFVMKEEIRI